MTKLVALLLTAAALSHAQSAPETAIRGVLTAQTEAWNRGDIDGFAQGYLHSATIVFVGKNIARGYDAMLARYKNGYPTPEKMGKLEFSGLEIQLLGPDYANVLGHFHLTRTAAGGGDAAGVFTLLFQRTHDGWKIIQDHTS